jgi:hypothetical protein
MAAVWQVMNARLAMLTAASECDPAKLRKKSELKAKNA